MTSAGQVFHFGDAVTHGSAFGSTLNGAIVGIGRPPTEVATGWWAPTAGCTPTATPPSSVPPGQSVSVSNVVGITAHGERPRRPHRHRQPQAHRRDTFGRQDRRRDVVTLTGPGFLPGATVAFGSGSGTTVDVVSTSTITVKAPAHGAGAVTVTVTTSGGTSNAKTYTYDPVPTITSLTPTAGLTAGGTTLTVNGTGFIAGATVSFGAAGPGATVHVVSTAKLTVKTPAHSAGTVTVTVTTPGGTSNAKPYSYDNGPSITSITPTAGKVLGGTVVTVNGANFVPGATVDFGTGNPGTTVDVVSTAKITVKAAAHAAGAVTVTVTTPGGTSNPASFTYDPVPTLTKVTPSAGKLGGTMVTLTGTGFRTGATSVTFGAGNHGITVHVTGTTTLTVTTPGHAVGTVTVTVTTPGGTSNPAPSPTTRSRRSPR